MKLLFILALGFLGLSIAATYAGEMDGASKEALLKTIQMLNSPMERNAALEGNSNGQYMDRQVKSIAGGSDKTTAEIYDFAGKLFQRLVESNNGDAAKVLDILQDAKAHPEKFIQSMTPEERRELSGIGKDITPATSVPVSDKPKAP